MTVILPRGMETSMFFRLCSLAPLMMIFSSMVSPKKLDAGRYYYEEVFMGCGNAGRMILSPHRGSILVGLNQRGMD